MIPSLFASEDERWAAVSRRNRNADGLFVYAVATTGVFCRPSCASRQPLRKNVTFFTSSEEATRAGFRPCKRCQPTTQAKAQDPAIGRVVEACRIIERGEIVRTREIADAVGLSAYYFQRVFKKHVGVTPQAYRRRVLAERARGAMRTGPSITAALYDAGYTSSSRFYDGVGRELGMTPRSARNGARGELVTYALRECSLGLVLVAWTSRGVCDVRFGDDEHAVVAGIRSRFASATLQREGVPEWVDAVVDSVETPMAAAIPLDIAGTAFQQRVWQQLRRIPLGQTRSYAQIAEAIGAPNAARAVARVCAANNLAVLVPCHRVIRSNGDVSGYRWGTERKELLLKREAAARGQKAPV